MSTVTGTVEWKGQNKYGGYSIKVNGNFYNSKFEPKCSLGDFVEFDDGGKKYINALKVGTGPATSVASPQRGQSSTKSYRANGEEGGFPIHPGAYERALDRRNALQVAAHLLPKASPEEIVKLARYFEAYTTGDLERVQVENMFNDIAGDE